MGKSPGKWIKTVLLGKKSSKSSYPKGKEKAANEREVVVAARASETDVAVASPFISQLISYAAERDERKLELGNNESANISQDDGISPPTSHSSDSQKLALRDSPYGTEKEEQAATMLQATFRGYLARRAFWALKGIIRLQALIRGHLVRRQAVATLCCTMGIVKLQAQVRGVIVRHSDSGLEVQKKCIHMNPQESNLVLVSLQTDIPASIGKLSANTFVLKLVASSPIVMPLHLHYDSGEPNSVWNWLERWSASCFWRPIPQPKKYSKSKVQRKQVKGQAVEMETGRPKRSVRRIPPANLDGTSVQATYELDKPKRNLRKVSNHPVEPVQENPQKELEKVKRNLRKVHNPVVESSLHSEFEFEKPKQSLERVSNATNLDIMEQRLNNSADKTDKETTSTINSSSEKMKKETVITVNTTAEKMRKETATINSSTERIKKDTALMVNSFAGKMKEETTSTVNSLAEKMKKETTSTVNNSTERMNKETALTANGSAEKTKKEENETISISLDADSMTVPLEMNETSDLLHADPLEVESKPIRKSTVKDENTPLTNGELNRKEDSANNESHKSGKNASNHAKQDRPENGPQSSPALPSYMAATKSAKAKLKLQGSIRSSPDGGEKTNLSRRQSLPSAANSKISLRSPRTQRLVQSGEKMGHKSDRSAMSSRDGNGKVAQVEWRR